MKHVGLFVAAAASAAWVALLVGRGGFWRVRLDEHLPPASMDRAPTVGVVVPARDEADGIGTALRSLAAQRYPGRLDVALVDDRSADATAEIARRIAATAARPIRVLAARDLAAGWTGKLNALDTALASAPAAPDYWLFTDADIAHDADNVAGLVALAERERLDLASLMVRLRCESRWERLLVPAFVFFFAKLYPFPWSNDVRRATAAAAGGCVLVRSDALRRIGGLAAIRGELIDDCALAARVKRSGGRIWLGWSARTTSLRPYDDLATIWRMVKRTAFTQLRRSYAITAATLVGLVLLYGAPYALVLGGIVRRDAPLALVASVAVLAQIVAYRPTLKAYERPTREALGLPVAAALYSAMTVDSAATALAGRHGTWKGRSYDATGEVLASA